MFRECKSLKHIIIPDLVETIKDDAFFVCSSLESIVFGDSVQDIGYSCLSYCESLTYVILPKSVIEIKSGFLGSESTKVFYKGTEEEWNKIPLGGINGYLLDATKYYYSETEPTKEGNYWHYSNNEPTIW